MKNEAPYSPPWLLAAASEIGTKEIVGPKHNSRITGWLKRLGAWWSDDETPWCGVFAAQCMQQVGLPLPKAYYRASSWEDYGQGLRPERLAPGAILVFARKGGGHVGFYMGENATHYAVLGGNQSNAVNIAKIAKSRMTASRWPTGIPVVGKPTQMLLGGIESKNEA